MAKKMIMIVTAIALFMGAAFAAEKVKENKNAGKTDKPEVTSKVEGAKVCPMQKQKEGLIDQLIKAYKADDKKAMDEIITKLEKRQKQMKKFAQFERWHQIAHRRMMMRGWGFQQGPNRGGCWGCQQGWQRGGFGGCPGMQMNQNWGPPAGGFRPMPQWRNPGGCAPMPQMKGCPQGPNQQFAPPAEKPGAMWNDNDQAPDSEEIATMNDQELFAAPDNELALDDDTPADSEW
jgi:hypothetical protein